MDLCALIFIAPQLFSLISTNLQSSLFHCSSPFLQLRSLNILVLYLHTYLIIRRYFSGTPCFLTHLHNSSRGTLSYHCLLQINEHQVQFLLHLQVFLQLTCCKCGICRPSARHETASLLCLSPHSAFCQLLFPKCSWYERSSWCLQNVPSLPCPSSLWRWDWMGLIIHIIAWRWHHLFDSGLRKVAWWGRDVNERYK